MVKNKVRKHIGKVINLKEKRVYIKWFLKNADIATI